MEFVFVKGNCFSMGDIFEEGWDKETPVHTVCLSDFYIGKYEVTQSQYKQIMGENPSNNASFWSNTENYPVIQVSWLDTLNYIEKLNQKGTLVFRLPTESEWEFAARSGGKKEKFSGSDNVDEVSWYKLNSDPEYNPDEWLNSGESSFESDEYLENNEDSLIHPVGQKKSNGLGLYDMSGNAYEWCSDYYDEFYYERLPKETENPKGPENSKYGRVMRGGSWYSGAWNSRTNYRMRQAEDFKNFTTGFRLVLVPPKQ